MYVSGGVFNIAVVKLPIGITLQIEIVDEPMNSILLHLTQLLFSLLTVVDLVQTWWLPSSDFLVFSKN